MLNANREALGDSYDADMPDLIACSASATFSGEREAMSTVAPGRHTDVRNPLKKGVTRKGLFAIKTKSDERIAEGAIRDELSRILESSMFVQSDRLGRFLRFTVETTLEGKADVLKE